jgi:hypothetical protein
MNRAKIKSDEYPSIFLLRIWYSFRSNVECCKEIQLKINILWDAHHAELKIKKAPQRVVKITGDAVQVDVIK